MLSWVKWALSFCALALFAAGAFVCVAKLVRAPAVGPARRRAARREMLLAALAFLLFAAFVQGVVALCAMRQSPGAGLENALAQFFGGIDAPHYISLARYGYQNEWNEAVAEQHLRIVFFPLFPWLLRALNAFGVLPWYVLGCAVQLPLFAGCGAALYALAAQSYGPRAAARACIWLLAFPGTFFFALPMTESLFLLLCLGFFLLLQHGRPLAAGAAGFLCALARSPGALLCGAAAVWLWQAVRAKRVRLSPVYAVCVAGPVLGLLGYFRNRKIFRRIKRPPSQRTGNEMAVGIFIMVLDFCITGVRSPGGKIPPKPHPSGSAPVRCSGAKPGSGKGPGHSPLQFQSDRRSQRWTGRRRGCWKRASSSGP